MDHGQNIQKIVEDMVRDILRKRTQEIEELKSEESFSKSLLGTCIACMSNNNESRRILIMFTLESLIKDWRENRMTTMAFLKEVKYRLTVWIESGAEGLNIPPEFTLDKFFGKDESSNVERQWALLSEYQRFDSTSDLFAQLKQLHKDDASLQAKIDEYVKKFEDVWFRFQLSALDGREFEQEQEKLYKDLKKNINTGDLHVPYC